MDKRQGFGIADVEQGLAGLGLREEGDEIDRMPVTQCNADLRVVLEAADTRAVAGARVDDCLLYTSRCV